MTKYEDELPTIDEFIGSDLNYTGDMSTKEYIQSIRGKGNKEIQDAYNKGFEQGKFEERERMLELITQDFVEIVANFYMTDENRELAFELWRSVKKQALKQK